MSVPTTSNIGLIVPNTGDLAGQWGALALNPDLLAIDGFIGGIQTISVSSAPITLTAPAGSITPGAGPTQSQNRALKVTGTLTSNVQITLPLPGDMIIHNLTTGAFVVTFAAASAGQVIGVGQGCVQRIYNDGTNVYFVGLPDVGTYLDISDATVPAWINACTVPPYLNCDGSTFNAATYPYLAVKLSGNTLPDFRGRSSYYLNGGTGRLTNSGAGIDGNTRFASGGTNGIALSAGQIPTITSNNAGQNITVSFGARQIAAYSNPSIGFLNNTGLPGGVWDQSGSGGVALLSNITTSNNISTTYTNGSQSVVQATSPGVVSGIRLIRAG
jgi:hypothetical protein